MLNLFLLAVRNAFCDEFNVIRTVCGDDENSGHGWTNNPTVLSEDDLDEGIYLSNDVCHEWCEIQGVGCCEYRGGTPIYCLHKAEGVYRTSLPHVETLAAMCRAGMFQSLFYSHLQWTPFTCRVKM